MIQEIIKTVSERDPEVGAAIAAELARERDGLELIASENVVSEAVMCAMGSVLTNKYAEGYPGKRYYGGCACVDVVENIAIERACRLFGAKFANVQPHSGAQVIRRILRTVKSRRHRNGHESCARRTPHARKSRQYFRYVL